LGSVLEPSNEEADQDGDAWDSAAIGDIFTDGRSFDDLSTFILFVGEEDAAVRTLVAGSEIVRNGFLALHAVFILRRLRPHLRHV
jgi:hypothetical protein